MKKIFEYSIYQGLFVLAIMYTGADNQTVKTITVSLVSALIIAHIVGLIASVFCVGMERAFFIMLFTILFTILCIGAGCFIFAEFFVTHLENANVNSSFFICSLIAGIVDGFIIHMIYWKNREHSMNNVIGN